jgi:hypothetical protein
MSRDEDEELDRSAPVRSGGRKKRSGGGCLFFAVLLVAIAIGVGVGTYKAAKEFLESGENADLIDRIFDNLVSSKTQNDTDPVNTPEVTETPVATVVPAATDTPSPMPKITLDSPYLENFTDTRDPLANIRNTGFDCYALEGEYPFEVKGVYVGHMTNGSRAHDMVTWLSGFTELNAVVIDVRDDYGYITYDMDCDIVKELGIVAPRDEGLFIEDMPGFLRELHSRGIYCIARIVCFKEGYFTDSEIATKHTDWLLKTSDGEVYRDGTVIGGVSKPYAWLNFYNTEVLDFIMDISVQAVKDGFDEICYDYMRMPSGVSSVDFDFGGNGEELPSRTEQMAKFVRYACNVLKPMGAYVSGSVYGITIDSKIDSDNLGQDYKELSKYLDYICPMVYPSHYGTNFHGITDVNEHPYELIMLEMRNSEKKLEEVRNANGGQGAMCRPWLQAFSYDFGQVRAQVDACEENNVYTWLFWNASAKYDQEYFLTKEEEILSRANRYRNRQ